MIRRIFSMVLLAAAGLAPLSLLAQRPSTPAPDLRRPFRFDPNAPVERAVPVEKPIPRAIPVERPSATPRPAPAAPKATPAPPEPDEPGTIRVSPGAARSADQAQLDIADSYYAKKQFEQAAPEYERYLSQFPTGSERATALFRLAECYRRSGSLNGAKSAYENLLGHFTSGEFIGPAAYRLADLYYQEKDYREALPLYRKASVRLKDAPVANAAKFYTGRCLEALGQKMDARISYEELVSVADNNPFQDASRLSLALLLKEAGRTSDALKQVQALAKEAENPDLKMEAMVRAGLWLGEMEQPAKAEQQLKAACELGGNSKWKEVARLSLLRMQYNSGKYDQVLATYAEAGNQFSPEARPDLLLLAANANRQLNKNTEARALYDQIVKDYPTTPYAREAQFERLKLLYAANDSSLLAEIDNYLAANADAPDRDEAMLMKAEYLYKKQDYRSAVTVYSALGLSHGLSGAYKGEALFKEGFCYLQLHDLERGMKALTTFIDQYPTNKSLPYALIQRGLAYQQLRNLPAAVKDYDEIISRYPKASEREFALQQKALILGQQGDNAGMLAAFRLLLKSYPETAAKAQANYWIGWAAFEAKNYKDAIEPLRAARDLDKEQYFEKATFRVLLAAFNLENKAETAKEVAVYSEGGKEKVPSQILRWLGTENYKENAFDQAEKYFEMLAPREEATPDDHLYLGRARLKLGKFQEACTELEAYVKAVKEPVPKATGLLDLVQARLGVKDFDGAQQAANEALTLQPEGALNGEGRIAAGDVEAARGRYDEAAKLYRAVSVLLDDDSVTPRALEKAVAAYRKVGNEAEARKTLNLLQSRYPEYYQRNAKAP